MNTLLITIGQKASHVTPMRSDCAAFRVAVRRAVSTNDLVSVIGHDGEYRWVNSPLPLLKRAPKPAA